MEGWRNSMDRQQQQQLFCTTGLPLDGRAADLQESALCTHTWRVGETAWTGSSSSSSSSCFAPQACL
eukprot:1149463-Pelagomonas_calceolata.AAC.1